jgi:hypothetical protein
MSFKSHKLELLGCLFVVVVVVVVDVKSKTSAFYGQTRPLFQVPTTKRKR